MKKRIPRTRNVRRRGGRRKGTPLYGSKTKGRGVVGSYYITKVAAQALKAATIRSGVSRSDAIEFCVRASAGMLTKDIAKAIVSGFGYVSGEEVQP